jgi:hypothetical protein
VSKQVAESMKGDFVGYWVNFYIKDSVAIIRPIENGPRLKQEYGWG